MMFQLELVPSVEVPSPPTLHELKQDGRAFVVQTWRGWVVWMPHRRGWISGMYFDEDDFGEAIAEADEFNQQKGER